MFVIRKLKHFYILYKLGNNHYLIIEFNGILGQTIKNGF